MDRKSEIAGNLQAVEDQISRAVTIAGRKRSEVTLIAVTKNFPVSDIEILYSLGIRDFGENREQEARAKVEALQTRLPDIRWHFQGQLQRNKLASIGSWAYMVHSVDDVKYLKGLSDGAQRRNRVLRVLIQISLDPEFRPGRGGTDCAGAEEILSAYQREREELSGIELVGVMGVAPIGADPSAAFSQLNTFFLTLAARFPHIEILSAGMSGDYEAALIAGATHIRVGSSILGSRT